MVDQTMLMMLCAEERVEELIELLDAHPEVTGFTGVSRGARAPGAGSRGPTPCPLRSPARATATHR